MEIQVWRPDYGQELSDGKAVVVFAGYSLVSCTSAGQVCYLEFELWLAEIYVGHCTRASECVFLSGRAATIDWHGYAYHLPDGTVILSGCLYEQSQCDR